MGVVVVYLVVLLVADVLLAFIPASIARSKGRSGFAFYMFGLLFFVPATITAAVLKPDEAELRIKGRVVVRNICPHCRSDIPRSATVCPHCTRDIYTPKPMDVARSTIEADLRRVDELHESGVLTATEHQEARSKLIDRHVGG